MTDWIAIARARGLDLPDEILRQRAGVLEALEALLEEAKKQLPHDTEPAPVFQPVSSDEVEP